jgi:hypothetical protein
MADLPIASDDGAQEVEIVQSATLNKLAIHANGSINVGTTVNDGSPFIVSVTAATGVAVTATLAAVAGFSHYINLLEITKYFTAANAASATPLLVTTTNLGGLTFSFGQPLGIIGSTDERIYSRPCLKSATAGVATTIVCPATAGIIWRINVLYDIDL